MAFTLEYDCFAFPAHIGACASIGPHVYKTSVRPLDLRKSFGINLAGVMRQGNSEPDWFPGPDFEVAPGDLGLIVRCPCRDGSTEPTVTDEDLQPLMTAEQFTDTMQAQLRAG